MLFIARPAGDVGLGENPLANILCDFVHVVYEDIHIPGTARTLAAMVYRAPLEVYELVDANVRGTLDMRVQRQLGT